MLLRRRDREKWVSTNFSVLHKKNNKTAPHWGAVNGRGWKEGTADDHLTQAPAQSRVHGSRLLRVTPAMFGLSLQTETLLPPWETCSSVQPTSQWFKKSHVQQEFSQKQQHNDHEHLFVDFCKQWKQKHHWNRSIIARDAACWPSVIQRSITSFPTLPFETL